LLIVRIPSFICVTDSLFKIGNDASQAQRFSSLPAFYQRTDLVGHLVALRV